MSGTWDQIEGNWEQVKGSVKQYWGKLTDDDLLRIRGRKQELAGKLQERYGYTKEKVEDEIERFGECFKRDPSCCGSDQMKEH